MGFLRRLCVRAALWGFFVLACKPIEQPIAGPATLTPEWKTFDPPEPLRVAGREEQTVCLEIVGTVTDTDLQNGVVVNGHRHVVGGEVIDAKQTPFALKVGAQGGNRVCLSRAGTPPRGPDYPENIIKLRLRSEPELQVERIWWHSVDQH
jgi:hypothetical protein